MYDHSYVIVIGKNYSTSLGVIRALGEAGYKCIAIQASRKKQKIKTPELFSRYVEKYYLAFGDCEKEVLRILDALSDGGRKLIIPIDDYSAYILDKHYDSLAGRFFLPSVNRTGGALNELMKKDRQKEMAAGNGVLCAKSVVLNRNEQKQFELTPDLPFPCFVKPNISAVTNKNSIQRCDSPEELKSVLNSVSAGVSGVLAEEFLEITNEYVICGLSLDGYKVIIPGMIQKTKVGEGSLKGITAKGIPVHGERYSELIRRLENMIRSIRLTGLFDIEIIESNGQFFFNELNLRNGAAGYAVTANGVNLPALYADYMLRGKEFPDSCDMRSEKDFVSEKVEMDSFAGRHISFREMRKDIRSAQVRFIKDPHDIKPYLHFLKFSFFKVLMKRGTTD